MKKYLGAEQILATKVVDQTTIRVKLLRRDGSIYWRLMRMAAYDALRVVDSTCPECRDSGEGVARQCPRCQGSGNELRGIIICTICKGQGVKNHVRCWVCLGTGERSSAEGRNCSRCGGRGVVSDCRRCHGTGYLGEDLPGDEPR